MPLVAYGGGGEMTATKEFQGADVRPEVEDWLGTWPPMSWASKAHGIRYHLDKSEVNRMVVASFIKNCVGFLYVDNPGRVGPRKIPVGTGFFVTVENRYGNGVNYLVTAKHVWEELNDHPPGYVRLNRKDPPSEEWGARNLPLKGNWVFHADENVDLAVLPWAPDTADLILESWDIVKFCAAEDSERRKSGLAWPPTEGTPVLFAAMMPNYTGRERNYPIVRVGRVALVTDETLKGKYGLSDYYLIESQVYPGNSGAPVWATYTWHPDDRAPTALDLKMHATNFMGVLCAGWPAQQEVLVRKKPKGREMVAYYNLGIAMVVPAAKLLELLMTPEMRAMRDRRSPPFESNPVPLRADKGGSRRSRRRKKNK
jgi:hypothetical protein